MSDITYLRTGEGWVYLAAFIDGHSRRIIGWAMDHHTCTLTWWNGLCVWRTPCAGNCLLTWCSTLTVGVSSPASRCTVCAWICRCW
ncbi:DDE-type integrase/transposase/recombinase [Corynebacterium sp.]|uniref:DDE-type integrase/transposase/recombinase n=1 Tax=Corynebacterium sp. TaxID=1720 RepID=UPI0037BFEE02